MSDETQADVSSVQDEGNATAETAPAVETDNKEETATTETEVKIETKPEDYGIETKDKEAGIDWKKRYDDSTREFETRYKPMEEDYKYFDNLLKNDPLLARQVAEAQARAGQGSRVNQTIQQPSVDLDKIVEEKLQKRLEPIDGLLKEQEQQQKAERVKDIINFEKKYGAQLFKNATTKEAQSSIKKEIGATAATLFRDGRTKSYSEALEKAMIIHNPDILVRQGESRALAGKASKDQASFESQTSVSSKGKEPSGPQMNQAQKEFMEQMGYPQK